ncbi:RNA polymerase sigma-70 factor [Chitinophaga agrisoli]|uniref:RNA polymerase sigma-70 factor n=1 Tax=Chitinophaga agrisoli TaxID=2607653 RepID=A0A5B2VK07_9BACT|nr:RNA polymerase sigma-70 factor [Chitinophaga agrisoli]KAA2239008.1 RNA polymerase sigma-70 factor [Chitinophaga agrisoli]
MLESVTQAFIDLIAEKREGDAYQLLYKQYHITLLQFAAAYLKAKEPAEEIVNDVLYKVWQKKETIVEISNLRAYLFTAVRNACLNQLAKQKEEQGLMSAVPFKDLTTEDPESIIISMELHDCIRNAINALPPRCKQIYEMVRIEGLRNKDVAAQLNISINTIDAQLAIALKRLVQAVSAFNSRHPLSSSRS